MKHWNSELLEQLLKVQDTDLKIRALELQVQVYNQRSKEEDTELSKIKADIAAADEALAAAESQNQMYSSTLEDIRSAIKGLLTTKAGVPKPRTRSSTEALKIEEEKLESLVEETGEQLVHLSGEREVLLGRAAERAAELESETNGPEAEIRKLQLQIRRLDKQREEEVSGIPSLLLKHYDRLRSSRSGIGLTILRDGVCTVCCMQMPTAIISKLSHGEKIAMCPACGRMVARIENNFLDQSLETEGEDSGEIERPSRKLRRVKTSKSRETAAERKAALKNTIKRSVEKKLAQMEAAGSTAAKKSAAAAAGGPDSSGAKDVKGKKSAKVSKVSKKAASEKKPVAKKPAKKSAPAAAAEKKAPASKKPAQKTSEKKPAVKKAEVPKKAPVKKAAAPKAAVKKAPAQKSASKAAAKKPAAKKTVPKKPAAPKNAAKKPSAKKTVAKKAPVKKAPAKKAPAKKAAAKKAPAKKPAPKKAPAKKAPAKKAAKKPAKKK